MSLSKELLDALYNQERLSMAEIAERLGCSQNTIAYWMQKHDIPRRNISEAIYQLRNPDGDPFTIRMPETEEQREFFQLAIGLYIGEGKRAKHGEVAIANTDPRVVRAHLATFLAEQFLCLVDREYGLRDPLL